CARPPYGSWSLAFDYW
nr:immunoglobulin heavy chain junction region [Macaca mulatta]MOV41072.1 immunoglobulin heavy chain junction region [Macaca mulatta]MOV43357.1 immunoglobulin heavy chain junction region [Macaca mulatta]MOV44309.1 immunoglobulin heavy chain junction region [Macaca mulatta]MOV45138.1 immunoglobulin heavy chain junction region [Macaca mulatta]